MVIYLATRQELNTDQLSILRELGIEIMKVCDVMGEIFYRSSVDGSYTLPFDNFNECFVFVQERAGGWSLLTPMETEWYKLHLDTPIICDQFEAQLAG